jgi:hypothetical protein
MVAWRAAIERRETFLEHHGLAHPQVLRL